MLKNKFKELFNIDLRALAAFRICISLFVISDLIVRATALKAHYADFGVLPRSAFLENFANPWQISLHFISGETAVQAALFLLNGAFAFMLLLGYQTWWANLGTWAFMVSLHSRNPMIIQGGDLLFRMVLFWSLFLPLGARYSIDQARHPAPEKKSTTVSSIGTFAFFCQIVFLYWFTAAIKLTPVSRSVWWEQGTAVYNALSVDQFARPFGHFLLRFPTLLKFLNYFVLGVETIGPLLLFSPFFTKRVRTFAVLLFISLHLGLGSSLALGPFPWIASISMLPFLPGEFWDRVESWVKRRGGFNLIKKIEMKPFSWRIPFLPQFLAAFFVIYVFFWNLGTVYPKYAVPPRFQWLGYLLGLDQRWNMFSPPLTDDGWYVIPGKLKNGREIDLFRNREPVSWEKPPLVSATYKNERWRKYMMNIWMEGNSGHRLYYGKYLCRNWNSHHSGDEQLEEFEIFFMREDTSNVQTPQSKKVSVWKHYCFKVPDSL